MDYLLYIFTNSQTPSELRPHPIPHPIRIPIFPHFFFPLPLRDGVPGDFGVFARSDLGVSGAVGVVGVLGVFGLGVAPRFVGVDGVALIGFGVTGVLGLDFQ